MIALLALLLATPALAAAPCDNLTGCSWVNIDTPAVVRAMPHGHRHQWAYGDTVCQPLWYETHAWPDSDSLKYYMPDMTVMHTSPPRRLAICHKCLMCVVQEASWPANTVFDSLRLRVEDLTGRRMGVTPSSWPANAVLDSMRLRVDDPTGRTLEVTP